MVRLQIITDDGVVLYVTYTGVFEMTEALVAAMIGDERYAWVDTTVFVAHGKITATGVEYEVFRVT